MTAAVSNERTFDMGNDQIQALFEDLRYLRRGQDAQTKELADVKLKLNDLENKFDSIDEKITNLKCAEHAEDLKKASDFILVHETKEKTLFGIRADFMAWFAFFVSIVASIKAFIK